MTTTPIIDTIQLEAVCRAAVSCRLYSGIDDDGMYTEATFVGYRPAELVMWDVQEDYAAHEAVKFTFNGGAAETIEGSFIADAGGKVLFAEAFDEPFTVEKIGDELEVMPRIKIVG